MVHQWLPTTIPPAALSLAIALAGVLAGAMLWLTGARHSRAAVTLSAVALGTILGKQLPGWLGWSISGMGPAVAGAIVFGVAAFALHRGCVGAALGLSLGIVAAAGAWMLLPEMRGWSWPAIDGNSSIGANAAELWSSLPARGRQILPFACGAGLLSGFCLTIRWPRFAVSLLYSLLGVTLLAGMGLPLLKLAPPQATGWLPTHFWTQAATLGGLVLFGALAQWRGAPAMSSGAPAPRGEEPPKPDPE